MAETIYRLQRTNQFGRRDRARRIERFRHVAQMGVNSLGRAVEGKAFVGENPENDRWIVAVAFDHFNQFALRVLQQFGVVQMLHAEFFEGKMQRIPIFQKPVYPTDTDVIEADFAAEHHAHVSRLAQFIDVMRIVRQSDKVGVHVAN